MCKNHCVWNGNEKVCVCVWLTLLKYVSLSKSFYPIYRIPLCTAYTHTLSLTLAHTHHTALPLFSTGLSSQYILPYLFSCYLFSLLSSLTHSLCAHPHILSYIFCVFLSIHVGHHTFPVLLRSYLSGCVCAMWKFRAWCTYVSGALSDTACDHWSLRQREGMPLIIHTKQWETWTYVTNIFLNLPHWFNTCSTLQ